MVRTPAMVFALLMAWSSAVAAELGCDEITAFVREGCPHCADAKIFLADLKDRYPSLSVEYRDVVAQRAARADFERLHRAAGTTRPGVPTFVICDAFIVGFDNPQGIGQAIEAALGISDAPASREATTEVDLPVFGTIDASEIGLPLFTIAIGLVDGFNPCAMWVLLFLLSILVHVKSRTRIALIAGVFVLVSGVIYFAFMAAWFEVFRLIGYARWLQLVLGALAITVGIIHIKDFFALHQGFSLSIPESAKPGIYQRVRSVVRAENLWAALAGITVMAVLVNFVELLCTAGLPALYTQVLTYYPLSTAEYYGYLVLYNLAYIFDDGLMVTIAVITLGSHKLQERSGRWLKLISGSLILVLGVLMVLAPSLLVF